MRPCPARSNSSREPSVNGLPLRFCSREMRSFALWAALRKKAPVAGIGEAAPDRHVARVADQARDAAGEEFFFGVRFHTYSSR